jgi:hypothetical protein
MDGRVRVLPLICVKEEEEDRSRRYIIGMDSQGLWQKWQAHHVLILELHYCKGERRPTTVGPTSTAMAGEGEDDKQVWCLLAHRKGGRDHSHRDHSWW